MSDDLIARVHRVAGEAHVYYGVARPPVRSEPHRDLRDLPPATGTTIVDRPSAASRMIAMLLGRQRP